MRILVVEDEQDLNRILAKTLTAEGYSVDTCFDGVEALDYLEGAEYDAIVLDVMMPRMDGFSLLAQMRESGNETPVIFLTAKDSVPDRVRGLDAGADDYLVKPFSFDELLARLRVVMRKRGGSATNVFTVADLTVDTASHHVTRGGRTIALSAKEFALLEYMIRNRGVVLSRERIENHLWNYDYSGGSNVVDVYMSYLRRKIDADYPTKLIHTVWASAGSCGRKHETSVTKAAHHRLVRAHDVCHRGAGARVPARRQRHGRHERPRGAPRAHGRAQRQPRQVQ